MRLLEILLERKKHTVVYYHGTSTVFLKSILKNGLTPTPVNKSWGNNKVGNPGAGALDIAPPDSYDGVYCTPSLRIAKQACKRAVQIYGGNPMILTIQYVRGSAGIDEDSFTGSLHYGVSEEFGLYLKAPAKAINKVKNRVLGDLKAPIVGLPRRADALLTQLVSLCFKIGETNQEELDQLSFDIFQNSPEYRKQVQSFLDSIKARGVSDNYIDNKSTGPADNIKINRTVGFRGKTRIIEIIDAGTNDILYKDPNT